LLAPKVAFLIQEFWLLFKALITIRSFLTKQPSLDQSVFFKMRASFRGTLQQVHGPAAALAYMLDHIDRLETVATLSKFAESQRWLLIREIAGGYQIASQKQKWLTHASGLCDFCQQEDSRIHRLLECPIGTEIRHQFQSEIINWISEDSLVPAFPMITWHPDSEALSIVHYQLPSPIWGGAILKQIN